MQDHEKNANTICTCTKNLARNNDTSVQLFICFWPSKTGLQKAETSRKSNTTKIIQEEQSHCDKFRQRAVEMIDKTYYK